MTQWAASTHSHVLFRCTVLTDRTSPRERHVHERASSGNADWESVATTRAHSTPEAQTGHFFHVSILSRPPLLPPLIYLQKQKHRIIWTGSMVLCQNSWKKRQYTNMLSFKFNNCPTRCDLFSLLYFCRQLYMFRVLTSIIRSLYSYNYSFWYWLTGSTYSIYMGPCVVNRI